MEQIQLFNCQANRQHNEYQLNQICIDKNCPNIFEPVCIECMEEQKNHRHNGGYKSLRHFMNQIQNLSLSQSKENTKKGNKSNSDIQTLPNNKQILQEWFETYQKEFEKLKEKIDKISTNLKEMSKYFIDSLGQQNDTTYQQKQDHPTNIQLDEIIENTLNSDKNQKKLTQNLQKLKNIINFEKGEVCLKAPPKVENNKLLYQKLQTYQHEMEKNLKNLEKYIGQAERESINQKIGTDLQKNLLNVDPNQKLEWKFEKSKHAESKNLYLQNDNTLVQGGGGILGVVYSSKSFNSGKHYFIIKVKQLEQQSNKLYVGIVPDKLKDDKPGTDNPYQFLNGDANNSMVKLAQSHIFDYIKVNETIKVVLDFPNNNFYIRDHKGRACYEINQKFKLKSQEAWRFTLFAYWKDIQIELIESI